MGPTPLPYSFIGSVLLQSLLPSPLVALFLYGQLNLDMELEGMLSCEALRGPLLF